VAYTVHYKKKTHCEYLMDLQYNYNYPFFIHYPFSENWGKEGKQEQVKEKGGASLSFP